MKIIKRVKAVFCKLNISENSIYLSKTQQKRWRHCKKLKPLDGILNATENKNKFGN